MILVIKLKIYIYMCVAYLQHEHGEDSSQEEVVKLMPQKVKKRRKVQTEDGVTHSMMLHLTTNTMSI